MTTLPDIEKHVLDDAVELIASVGLGNPLMHTTVLHEMQGDAREVALFFARPSRPPRRSRGHTLACTKRGPDQPARSHLSTVIFITPKPKVCLPPRKRTHFDPNGKRSSENWRRMELSFRN